MNLSWYAHQPDEFLRVSKIIESALKEEQKRSDEAGQEYFKKLASSPFQKPNTGSVMNEYYKTRLIFPGMLRRTLFVSVFSYLEHKLNQYCDFKMKEKQLKMKLKDVAGDGVSRAKTYLEKIVGLQLPQQEWQYVTEYNTIRNKIVHSGGMLTACDETDKLVSSITKRHKYIGFSKAADGATVEIDLLEGIVEEMVDIIKRLFNNIK